MPTINPNASIFQQGLTPFSSYNIDITEVVKGWIRNPESNLGLMLIGIKTEAPSIASIITSPQMENAICIIVEYEECCLPSCSTQFIQCTEDLSITTPGIYYTTPINISTTRLQSYFIYNGTNVVINANIQNSPDGIHYYSEFQEEDINSGEGYLLVPINFSKYIRLLITVPVGVTPSTINTWIDLQLH